MGLWKQVLTAVGNVGSGEDDLQTTTLEASGFYKNGYTIHVKARGRSGATGNNKTIKLKFGGTTIYTSGAVSDNNKKWSIDAEVYRTAADTQIAFARGLQDATMIAEQRTALTIDDGAAIIVKVTGEATADNDIICDYLQVVAVPAV